MNLAGKISLASSGFFLLVGTLLGVVKYMRMLNSPDHRAPVYIDIAHRAALQYSFAAVVIAQLVQYSPFSLPVQLLLTCVPLALLAATIMRYLQLGIENRTDNQFRERNFMTTWAMYGLIVGEVGGIAGLVWGFLQTQFLAR